MDKLDKIFRAYDVRGLYPDEINEEIAYKIGRATAKFLKVKEIVIGRDNRSSSESLFKFLCEGIQDEGIDIIDIGLVISPMLYWATVKYGYGGGIMITASHNPSEYNGFKIVKRGGISIGERSGLGRIKKSIKKERFKDKKRGNASKREILKEYIKDVLKPINLKNIKPLKVFADYSDGMANQVIPELFKNLPASLTTSPLEETDLGINFDRDGDRILFIDEKKQNINPDLITALLIHHFFRNAGKILYTVITSRTVKEEIEKNDNIPICSRVGYTFIKERMEKEKIIFGAESSGHYYFRNNYVLESPVVVLLKIIEIISKTKTPLSDLVSQFQRYYQERIAIPVKNTSQTTSIINRLENKYKTAKIYKIDGINIEFSDWWFNLRPSNTEPVLRLTIEADTKELLEEKKKEILKSIPS